MPVLLLFWWGCDSPDDCPADTHWSPVFGQCIGEEEEEEGTPTDTGAT